jgi:hypothetical protein
MKNNAFFFLLLTLWVMGCTSKTTETSANPADSTAVVTAPKADSVKPKVPDLLGLTGYYVGAFEASEFHKGKNPSYSNRINVSIDRIGDGKVEGHSVVAGNSRPFTGTYVQEGSTYTVEAAEPGDDKYDGKFSFTLNSETQTILGSWTANDPSLAVYERKYFLKAKTFVYDPSLELPEHVVWADLYGQVPEPEWQRSESVTDDVLKFNASTVKLKKEDVENMHKGDLEILRNSIYARHGYSFKNRKMRYVFDQNVDWYMPVSTDVSKELTKLEQENIALLKRYEEHAETYYDTFGR